MGWIEFASFIVGAFSGALVCYFGVMRQRTENAVEKQMRELQDEFTAYRENVNQHFHQTANLVNDLSANYISVQKHLETAASSFTEPPKSFSLPEEQSNALSNAKPEFTTFEIQGPTDEGKDAEFLDDTPPPPKDYAPKNNPEEQGTLEEGYGLQEQSTSPHTPPQ